ncbi:MAG: prolipoprotein diacylglyceryl transferase [Omnitrophica bacterium RIFCSPLOWO2_01_FULL_50_24]|nr:MAG: prolipoprotein diacylglyceryl transferase [Omnitrophica bacterium RIFCSPLOWO2_01_FULL_50_24]
MHPILFSLGPLVIHSYGVMVAIGVWAAVTVLRRNAAKAGLDRDLAVNLALAVIFFGFAGARLFYVFLFWEYFSHVPLQIVQIWKGGIVLYGGMAGGLAALWVVTKMKGQSFLEWLDLFLPPIALAQGFGRIGCFLNGCCYGTASSLPWAVSFPFLEGRVHPTQLYESLFCFALAAFLLVLWGKRPKPGVVSAAYFFGYALGRFVLELVRGDNPKLVLGLTLPQAVSVLVMVLSVFLLIRQVRNERKRDYRCS